MIVFLYGSDGYRRAMKARWWTHEYRKKHWLSPVLRLDMAEKEALPAFREFFGSVSLFDAYQLAVLENVFDSSEPAALVSALKSQIDRKEVVVIISEAKRPPAVFSFLLDTARRETLRHEALNVPEGVERAAFIKEEAARRGIVLEPAALRLVERASGSDTWRIATELDRAALLLKRVLGPADFPHLALEQESVESLLREFHAPSRAVRLAALEKLFSGRHEPAMLFNRLAYRDPQKLPAFADYDVLVKSGKLDYEEALLALAIN